MATQRTTQKKSSIKKTTAIKKTAVSKPKKSSSTSRTKKKTVVKTAAHTTGTLDAPILPLTSTHAVTPQERMLIEPLVDIKKTFQKHPEHIILLIGEYYLIAILFSIIGIACLYAVLALL